MPGDSGDDGDSHLSPRAQLNPGDAEACPWNSDTVYTNSNGTYSKDSFVAFSCKRRGFCPSGGARRMAETAAHLVDHVIPHLPIPQQVVSFPIPLGHLFATHPHLLSPAPPLGIPHENG